MHPLFVLGNPIRCDCRLRPISYWLASVGRAQGRASAWDEALCSAPQFLQGRPIGSVSEERLICVKTSSNSDSSQDLVNDENHDEAEFQLNPDVTFRTVQE